MRAIMIFLYVSIMFLVVIPGSCILNQAGESQSYYVSPGGDDESPGTMDQPFRSIDRVNSIDLDPGDAVCFEAGNRFEGTLLLDSLDSGNGEEVVLITSYGDGRAILDGGTGSALRADGCDHLLVRGLAFQGDGRKDGNTEDGVYITNGNFIHVDSVETSGFQKSGLRLHICDNSKITHVYAHDNGFAGIHVTGTTMRDSVKYDNQNLYLTIQSDDVNKVDIDTILEILKRNC